MCPQSVYKQPSSGGNPYNREKGYLSDEVFGIFLENARKYARSVSVSFFGEQMLHPKFDEYITRLSENRRYKLILFSNWSLVTDEMIPVIRKCDIVKISLDASNAKLFYKLCPDSRYRELTGRISKWLSLEDRPATYLVYTISSLNEYDKGAFLEKWLSKLTRRDGVIAKSVISYGGVMKDDYMTNNRCRVLEKPRLIVAWNGDVSPCNLDVNMSMNAGNLLATNDLSEIVNSRAYKYQLDVIRDKRGICAYCFDANNHRNTVIHRGQYA